MARETKRIKNLVNGEFVESVGGGWQEVVNPASGEKIAEVPKGS